MAGGTIARSSSSRARGGYSEEVKSQADAVKLLVATMKKKSKRIKISGKGGTREVLPFQYTSSFSHVLLALFNALALP